MRVLESASWRPVLKNLTLLHVARFREQIDEINLIGEKDLDTIVTKVRECSEKLAPALSPAPTGLDCPTDSLSGVEHVRAEAPKQLRLDRAGFFIVLPQPQKGLIVCEHYENSGRLAHVIEGRRAALIAATIVERGLVTQLDHAAYLGRELQKAEAALTDGLAYEQDAAQGELTNSQQDVEPTETNGCGCTNDTACNC
jgi:tetrahydromethanopterin S-methyltransferase subunit A